MYHLPARASYTYSVFFTCIKHFVVLERYHSYRITIDTLNLSSGGSTAAFYNLNTKENVTDKNIKKYKKFEPFRSGTDNRVEVPGSSVEKQPVGSSSLFPEYRQFSGKENNVTNKQTTSTNQKSANKKRRFKLISTPNHPVNSKKRKTASSNRVKTNVISSDKDCVLDCYKDTNQPSDSASSRGVSLFSRLDSGIDSFYS